MRFSLIIPAYNEEGWLPQLLNTVKAARKNYSGGRNEVEVIVVDNDSSDSTAQIAKSFGYHVVKEEKHIIAAVRNTGAKAARGEILCFVDADSLIHPDTFNEIDRKMKTGKYVAGATGVDLDRYSMGIFLTFLIFLPFILVTGMDTGVVFCRREDFEKAGGYNEKRLFAEDVEFLLSLKKIGRGKKQKLARIRKVKAVTSSRKFDKFGEWHYFKIFSQYFLWVLFANQRINDFAMKYWYDGKRVENKRKIK